MNTIKETNVKYTTKINSNNDKTINIKSTNGANVTNVYDGDTGEFKYCYDHNKQCVKSYKHNGELYTRIDYSKYNNGFNNNHSRYDNDFNNGYSRYDNGYSKYNNSFNNNHSRYDNGYSKYNNSFNNNHSRYDNDFNNGYSKYNNGFNKTYSKRNKGYW